MQAVDLKMDQRGVVYQDALTSKTEAEFDIRNIMHVDSYEDDSLGLLFAFVTQVKSEWYGHVFLCDEPTVQRVNDKGKWIKQKATRQLQASALYHQLSTLLSMYNPTALELSKDKRLVRSHAALMRCGYVPPADYEQDGPLAESNLTFGQLCFGLLDDIRAFSMMVRAGIGVTGRGCW